MLPECFKSTKNKAVVKTFVTTSMVCLNVCVDGYNSGTGEFVYSHLGLTSVSVTGRFKPLDCRMLVLTLAHILVTV